MGSIRVRQGRYQANVRRKGYTPVTKTFNLFIAFIESYDCIYNYWVEPTIPAILFAR